MHWQLAMTCCFGSKEWSCQLQIGVQLHAVSRVVTALLRQFVVQDAFLTLLGTLFARNAQIDSVRLLGKGLANGRNGIHHDADAEVHDVSL